MKQVNILALHLAYGGVEKAVSEFANIMAERYEVRIISVYNMPHSPAYPIDSRVKIEYLLKETPNRNEFREAAAGKNPVRIASEGLKACRILILKKQCMIRAIRSIESGVAVATRDEHAVLLSRYGRDGVLKIMQLHQDHGFEKKLIRHFKNNYGRIDLFSLLSPKMAGEVKEVMKDNRHTKVLYVPNFIDRMPSETDDSVRKKTVLAVGRLDRVKGFDRLIGLFCRLHEKYPDWNLKIVGSGDEEKPLKEQIAASGAESYVEMTGRYTPDQVEKAMQESSVYAMTSHTEGFPFVLLEAMSCSLPIVAFDTRGGLDMIVSEGENGYLVEDGDAFLDAMGKLMEDGDLRLRMARRSRELCARFSRETVAETWYRLIEENTANE